MQRSTTPECGEDAAGTKMIAAPAKIRWSRRTDRRQLWRLYMIGLSRSSRSDSRDVAGCCVAIKLFAVKRATRGQALRGGRPTSQPRSLRNRETRFFDDDPVAMWRRSTAPNPSRASARAAPQPHAPENDAGRHSLGRQARKNRIVVGCTIMIRL